MKAYSFVITSYSIHYTKLYDHAVDSRQRDIQDDDRGHELRRLQPGIQAVVGDLRHKAILFKKLLEQLGEFLFVVDNQDFADGLLLLLAVSYNFV